MGSFQHIAVKVIIGKDGAADGSHAYNIAFQIHLFNGLGNQAVYDAVVAAGAVMDCLSVRSLVFSNTTDIYLPSFIARILFLISSVVGNWLPQWPRNSTALRR